MLTHRAARAGLGAILFVLLLFTAGCQTAQHDTASDSKVIQLDFPKPAWSD